MGTRGPIPKRTTERLGHLTKAQKDDVAVVDFPPAGIVEVPDTPTDLDPIARDFFESLKTSGQSRYYEPSDWAAAIYLVRSMTRQIRERKFSAIAFSAIWTAMGDMLAVEGARRRVRMEIQRAPAEAEDPSVTAIAEARKRLRG